MGYDTYTKLLAHFDGSDGATTHTAATGQTMTFQYSGAIDTAYYKFGSASAELRADYALVDVPDSDDWNFGSGDFTVDLWARFDAASTTRRFFTQLTNTSNFITFNTNSDALQFYCLAGSAVANYSSGSVLSGLTGFHHYALVRSGTNIYIFLDGTSLSLTASTAIGSSSLPNLTGTFRIGALAYGGAEGQMRGWIDEFRVSKGIARWTSDFTPPTSEYPEESSRIITLNKGWL